MDLLLIANNISSFLLVMACWWLTHTYAIAGFPYGRAIAFLWAAVGMSVLVTAFARNLAFDPNPLIVVTKSLLVVMCVVIARRVQYTHRHLISEEGLLGRNRRAVSPRVSPDA